MTVEQDGRPMYAEQLTGSALQARSSFLYGAWDERRYDIDIAHALYRQGIAEGLEAARRAVARGWADVIGETSWVSPDPPLPREARGVIDDWALTIAAMPQHEVVELVRSRKVAEIAGVLWYPSPREQARLDAERDARFQRDMERRRQRADQAERNRAYWAEWRIREWRERLDGPRTRAVHAPDVLVGVMAGLALLTLNLLDQLERAPA